MPERLIVLAAVATVLFVGVMLTRTMTRLRTRHVMGMPGAVLLDTLGIQSDGRHTLVAFSTPSCAACHTAQMPAVEKVHAELGEQKLRVISVNAAQESDVARAFGVLTVPSTVVLSPDGEVLAVNHGFAAPNKLVHQLQHAS